MERMIIVFGPYINQTSFYAFSGPFRFRKDLPVDFQTSFSRSLLPVDTIPLHGRLVKSSQASFIEDKAPGIGSADGFLWTWMLSLFKKENPPSDERWATGMEKGGNKNLYGDGLLGTTKRERKKGPLPGPFSRDLESSYGPRGTLAQ